MYVPVQHGSAKLWEQQKKSFKALLDTNWEKTAEEDFEGIYSECNVLEQEVNELLDHGQKDEICSNWDPDQNLLRLVRNATQEVDHLDLTEFNEASEYYAAITKYDADGFGEESAKTKLKGVKSLSSKLTSYTDRDDIRGIERRAQADHEPVLFKLGGGGPVAKRSTSTRWKISLNSPASGTWSRTFESKMVGQSGRTSTTLWRWLCGYKVTTKYLMKI
ncbi:hypothetical protein GCM10009067_41310 [Haloarcula sebkhae]|uniref:Primase-associated winged helix domain-containing protein n=1 Tax=Haloarcula sebkhae TaxID=932660 RepID=A0A830EQG4_9EURY|nr:hypothetical protein GCM10009067_41310 [Haloarcula sebkhae]